MFTNSRIYIKNCIIYNYLYLFAVSDSYNLCNSLLFAECTWGNMGLVFKEFRKISHIVKAEVEGNGFNRPFGSE